MEAVAYARDFSVESFLLQRPDGYELLDMLVQANVNLQTLSQEDCERLFARRTS